MTSKNQQREGGLSPALWAVGVAGAAVGVMICTRSFSALKQPATAMVKCPYSGNGNLTGKWEFLAKKSGTMANTGKGHAKMECTVTEFARCPGKDACTKLV